MAQYEKPPIAPLTSPGAAPTPPASAAPASSGGSTGAHAPDQGAMLGPIGPLDMPVLSPEAKQAIQDDAASNRDAAMADKDQEAEAQRQAELERRLQELQKQMDADVKSGNMGAYASHLAELHGVQSQLGIDPTGEAPPDAAIQQAQGPQTSPQRAFQDPGFTGPIPMYSGGSSYSGGSAASGGDVGPVEEVQHAPVALTADDRKMANFIDGYLASQGSPAAKYRAGELFVKYGRQNDVDPLALVAIAGHETGFGKLGVGVRKMLGVGAYDSNPNGVTPYDGLENQIKYGAKTFANLRAKGGASSRTPLGQQFAAVNRAGWATDSNWHNGITRWYNRVVRAA